MNKKKHLKKLYDEKNKQESKILLNCFTSLNQANLMVKEDDFKEAEVADNMTEHSHGHTKGEPNKQNFHTDPPPKNMVKNEMLRSVFCVHKEVKE